MLTPLEPWVAAKIGAPGVPLSRSALAAYQLAALRTTLELARRRSGFYSRQLAEAPPDLATLADLAAFPFTTAQDLAAQPLQLVCVSQDEIQRVVTLDSSGTTGAPKRVYFTAGDQELTVDFFRAGMSTFTEPGDRVLILMPVQRPGSIGDLLAVALERLGAHPIRHGPVVDYGAAVQTLVHDRVDVIVGIPIQAFGLVRLQGAATVKLKSVLLSADYVPDAVVREVERAWGCTVYNHYGMTEMGLGGGVECAARRGYHWREADLYIEIVNPITGRPVPDGEMGEIVFTTLTRRGMPLIRYRTGDLSRILPGACPCGTVLRTLERVRSRLSGHMPLGHSGDLTIRDLDEALLPLHGLVDYQATIVRGPALERLRLEMVRVPGTEPGFGTAIQAALDTIPAIRTACAAGALAMDLVLTDFNASQPRRLAKRVIAQA